MEDELMDGFRVLPLFIKVFLKISTSWTMTMRISDEIWVIQGSPSKPQPSLATTSSSPRLPDPHGLYVELPHWILSALICPGGPPPLLFSSCARRASRVWLLVQIREIGGRRLERRRCLGQW
jgi:hypothetical protein